jgi:hypothetical protein
VPRNKTKKIAPVLNKFPNVISPILASAFEWGKGGWQNEKSQQQTVRKTTRLTADRYALHR